MPDFTEIKNKNMLLRSSLPDISKVNFRKLALFMNSHKSEENGYYCTFQFSKKFLKI